jgi:ribosomal protein L37E
MSVLLGKIAGLRAIGATFEWGVGEYGKRAHAFPDMCYRCENAAMHKRTHVPSALCGMTFARDWPVVDEPGRMRCGSYVRMLIGGPA